MKQTDVTKIGTNGDLPDDVPEPLHPLFRDPDRHVRAVTEFGESGLTPDLIRASTGVATAPTPDED